MPRKSTDISRLVVAPLEYTSVPFFDSAAWTLPFPWTLTPPRMVTGSPSTFRCLRSILTAVTRPSVLPSLRT